jgi:hypothetical protein
MNIVNAAILFNLEETRMWSRWNTATAGMFVSPLIVFLLAGAVPRSTGEAAFRTAEQKPATPSTTDCRGAIQKLADAIQKNEDAQIKQLAEQIAKTSGVLDSMNTLAKRDPAGKKLVFGVGKKPGIISPDGIEAKIQNLSRRPQSQQLIDREAPDLEVMAYRAAALAEIAKAGAPERNEGMKKIKDWLEWSEAMRKSADELAGAAKAKNPAGIKTAAAKLNASCNNCHGVFRE